MKARVTIHLNQRAVTASGLRWNRCTPTRGVRPTARYLAAIRDSSQDLTVPASGHCAAILHQAGILQIELAQGSEYKDVLRLLNILMDKELEEARGELSGRNVVVETVQPNNGQLVVETLAVPQLPQSKGPEADFSREVLDAHGQIRHPYRAPINDQGPISASQLRQAFEAAQLSSKDDCFGLIYAIAEEMINIGIETKEVAEVLTQALEALDLVDDSEHIFQCKSGSFRRVVRGFSDLHLDPEIARSLRTEALSQVQAVYDGEGYYKPHALRDIAIKMAEIGAERIDVLEIFDRAIVAARNLEVEGPDRILRGDSYYIICNIISQMGEIGLVGEALDNILSVIKDIKDGKIKRNIPRLPYEAAEVFGRIILKMSADGAEETELTRIIMQAYGEAPEGYNFRHLIRYIAQAGLFPTALNISKRLNQERMEEDVFPIVVYEMIRAGKERQEILKVFEEAGLAFPRPRSS